MKVGPIQHGIQQIELDSWQDFYALMTQQFADSPAYVFRGQGDASWVVESSLDRWEREFSLKPGSPMSPLIRKEKSESAPEPPVSRDVHLRAFRQAIRAISPVNLPKHEEDLSWALAQHHGLRTPLLDWSHSPFVALFFAFEDERIVQGTQLIEPEERAVFALSTSAIGQGQKDGNRLFPRVYSPSGPVSRRLLAQSSLFVMMPEHSNLEGCIAEHFADESEAPGREAQVVLKKITIKNAGQKECLKMLNKMNINRLTLFPDLDGAARYINQLWTLDFDSSLGYFEDAEYAH